MLLNMGREVSVRTYFLGLIPYHTRHYPELTEITVVKMKGSINNGTRSPDKFDVKFTGGQVPLHVQQCGSLARAREIAEELASVSDYQVIYDKNVQEELARLNKPPASLGEAQEREAVEAPDGFEVSNEGATRRILLPYRPDLMVGLAFILVFFPALWMVAITSFYLSQDLVHGALDLQTIRQAGNVLIALLFASPVYIGITFLRNRTVLELNSQELIIKSEPLPWPTKRIQANRLVQLYCEERKYKHRMFYELKFLDRDEQAQSLIPAFHLLEEAQFLEQQLEAFYKIQDRKVSSEVE